MIHVLFRSISFLSDKKRSPEEEQARVEFLRVAIYLSWAGFALSFGLALFWGLGLFAGTVKTWVDFLFPVLFAGYAAWKLYFIRRAKRIVARSDALKPKVKRRSSR